jgi:hypothetical protein
MADEGLSAYSQRELRQVAKAFTLMGDEAVAEARQASNSLAEFALGRIREAGLQRQVSGRAVERVVSGAKVSKTSKTGLISLGFASQRFSGGATTQRLWAGLEFGSDRFKQFPRWSGRYGGGSRGWFIYPTLRKIQPELTDKWEQSVDQIVKKWTE